MTLFYCPVCGSLQAQKIPCLNSDRHAFLCLPVVQNHKDPLANCREENALYQVSLT